jgi:hypothetical protein
MRSLACVKEIIVRLSDILLRERKEFIEAVLIVNAGKLQGIERQSEPVGILRCAA